MPPLCLVARGGGAFMWAAPRPWGLTRGGQQHAVLPRGPVSSLRQTGVGAAGWRGGHRRPRGQGVAGTRPAHWLAYPSAVAAARQVLWEELSSGR